MAVQNKTEEGKGISPAVIIIPLGLGLGLAAALMFAAMAKGVVTPPPAGKAKLYGKVTDADSGAPAAGALITLDSMATYSDANGNYTLNDIDPGSYNITVEHTGHNTFSQSVTLTEGSHQLNVQIVAVSAAPVYGQPSVSIYVFAPAPGWKTAVFSCLVSNPSSSAMTKTFTLWLRGYFNDGYDDQRVPYKIDGSALVVTIPAGGQYSYSFDGRGSPPYAAGTFIQIFSGAQYHFWLEDELGNKSAEVVAAT